MHLDRRERQVDLLAKVTEVIRNVRLVQAFAREAHFERAFRHGGHDVVRSGLAVADAEQLSRALLNLVTNAVRHTREGDMLRLACTSSYGWARLVVADSGDGIRPGDLAHVFSPWYRANMREVGVGGLGLMIVREVASDARW